MTRFIDRRDAGQQLAREVTTRALADPLVLALPRGGVPVGFEVAIALHAPLDVLIVRKVGAPQHPEFGIGAIAEDGTRVADEEALRLSGVDHATFDRLAEREMNELQRRLTRYRKDRPLTPARDRDVVIVDDGLATGVTAEAALVAVRAMQPRRVLLAVPACATDTARRLRVLADEVICVIQPYDFVAVGEWYDDFEPTADATVLELLEDSAARSGRRAS
jgi:putative phosphoribosyl transferase